MAHNVKVVYDVSGVAIKKLRRSFSNLRNVAEQNTTKGASTTGVLCGPSRFSGEAYTILLCAVVPFFILILHIPLFRYFHALLFLTKFP
jgi:hypothetical protein